MTIIQIPLSKEIEKRLSRKIKPVGVSSTAYIKVLLAKDLGLLSNSNEFNEGNLFNADRDNQGQGLSFSEIRKMLK